MKPQDWVSGLIEAVRRRFDSGYRPRCRTLRKEWRVGAIAEAISCPRLEETGSFLHMVSVSNARDSRLLRVSVVVRASRRLATFDGETNKIRQIAQVMPHTQQHVQSRASYSGIRPGQKLLVDTAVSYRDELDLDPLTQVFEGDRESLPLLEYFL
jgi:hypothetical protein